MANQYSSELTEQRAIAVKLLSRGQATVQEIATHYGLARQTVQRWAAGIDVAAARQDFIKRAIDRGEAMARRRRSS
jgi:transposase-like protein